MKLLNGDCLDLMKDISDNSIDLLFCDLPYNCTSCKWDIAIDLNLFWKEVNRICKDTTPMFFTCSTKFGVSLINSNPKNFRYDLVWVKSAACGFLNAKKMPMKKHEMVYVFYRKLPLYDLSSHSHKFIKETENKRNGKDRVDNNGAYKNRSKTETQNKYDPPLPTSVVRDTTNYTNESELYGNIERPDFMRKNGESVYDPPLPNSLLEIKSEKGRHHPTMKPTELIKWCLKYYSKEGDMVLDPTSGSFSTAIACLDMSRNFIGIEMNEEIYIKGCERVEEYVSTKK